MLGSMHHRHRYLRAHRLVAAQHSGRQSCCPSSCPVPPAPSRAVVRRARGASRPARLWLCLFRHRRTDRWIIGWDLILEYSIATSTVAIGGPLLRQDPRTARPASAHALTNARSTRHRQCAGDGHRAAAVGAAVDRRARIGPFQHVMVMVKLAASSSSSWCRATRQAANWHPSSDANTTPMASRTSATAVSSPRLADFLRLHRLRRGFHGGGGNGQPQRNLPIASSPRW